MLDIRLVRDNPQLVEKDLLRRGATDKVRVLEDLLAHDRKRRELLQQVEHMKQKRNLLTQEIATHKRDGRSADSELQAMKELPDRIRTLDEEITRLDEKCRHALLVLPNLLHESVPFGKSDEDNVEVRRWGKPPHFTFVPKNHLELLESLDIIGVGAAAKIAGHGFFYFKNELALLNHAVMMFAADVLLGKGFTLIEPPYLMRRAPYEGVVALEDFENVMYKIENEDLYLIATSEHPMAAMHMDDVIEQKRLPLKLAGISPCFRREVGAHGKYTKGLFRMHQFHKIEQFVFCLPEQSWRIHEELQRNAEELYQALGLHYRVVNVCTGDIGSIAAKKYDIEVWMADRTFREAGSNSNCTDYQARRLNIKYRVKEGGPPLGYVHTLNNTALATSRVVVALLEQHQQPDGSVRIPEPLQEYMKMKEIAPKK